MDIQHWRLWKLPPLNAEAQYRITALPQPHYRITALPQPHYRNTAIPQTRKPALTTSTASTASTATSNNYEHH